MIYCKSFLKNPQNFAQQQLKINYDKSQFCLVKISVKFPQNIAKINTSQVSQKCPSRLIWTSMSSKKSLAKTWLLMPALTVFKLFKYKIHANSSVLYFFSLLSFSLSFFQMQWQQKKKESRRLICCAPLNRNDMRKKYMKKNEFARAQNKSGREILLFQF